MHLELLETQNKIKPKISRWEDIIKIRAEINEMEAKKIQKINKIKVGSLKR
jgi:hypothetical protein